MNIQQQAYEVVVRLADMERMRQMQVNTGDVQSAARTLDKMADVFGTGPTAAELRNAVKNAMPRGDMTSGNDYWRGTLAGFGGTYDNGSGSDSSVMDMVARAQNAGPLLEEVVPPALSAYARPGMENAMYQYATRLQYKVGSSLGAVLPMSVADTDRKIQEVNNRATLLDFVVRSPNLEVGSTLAGMPRWGFLPVERRAVRGLAGDLGGPFEDKYPYPGTTPPNHGIWASHGNAVFALTNARKIIPPAEVVDRIVGLFPTIECDDGGCGDDISELLDDNGYDWLDDNQTTFGEYIDVGFSKPCPKGSSLDKEMVGTNRCLAPLPQLYAAWLGRIWDRLPNQYKNVGMMKEFKSNASWAWGADKYVNFWFPDGQPAPILNPPKDTAASSGSGLTPSYTGGGAGGGGAALAFPVKKGIPTWVWIAGGGVVVLGVGALALMGGKKR